MKEKLYPRLCIRAETNKVPMKTSPSNKTEEFERQVGIGGVSDMETGNTLVNTEYNLGDKF